MRPYLAILYDSFREAMHSRVLWILLILIVVVLLALAPITITYPRTGRFFGEDIRDMKQLATALAAAKANEGTPQHATWQQLDEDLKYELETLSTAKEPDRRARFRASGALVKQLNAALAEEDLFTAEQLAALPLDAEGERLRAATSTNEEERRRLHRLAVEAAFPDQFRSRGAKMTQLKYGIWQLGDLIPSSQQRVRNVIDLVLLGFINFFVGIVGVLVGILVTASIVPNTFDAGSINLLLSKPISRSLLYLTKVFGGCWFVLINATLLVVGLWLLVGLRLGVWNERLLWSIPLFLFIFMVYYSVSAFAGLVWRNTIVAIVVTVIFWFACFLVGTAHDTIESLILAPQRFTTLLAAGEDTFAITQSGTVNRWDAEERNWAPAFNGQSDDEPAFARRNRLLGPVYDDEDERLVAIDRRGSRSALVEGRRDADFERDRIDRAPAGCLAITINQAQEILVADEESISRIRAKLAAEVEDVKLFGVTIPLGPKRGSFESLGPVGGMPAIARQAAVTFDRSNDALIVFQDGQLQRWEPIAGRYRPAGELALEGNYEGVQALIAAGGGVLAIAMDSGVVQLCDANTPATTSTHQPVADSVPRQVAVDGQGNVAVLFHSGQLWTRSSATGEPLNLPATKGLTAFHFDPAGRILTADRARMVRLLSANEDGYETEILTARPTMLERVQRYIITPLYTVFPKPGKLKETNAYLLTKPSAILQMAGAGLDEPQPQLDPWTPVWSSGLFAVAMLLIGCVYISRQDF